MADLTQTAANVAIGALAVKVRPVQVGEAVTAGMPVYRLSTDGKWYQGDADDEDKDDIGGITLTPASTDGFALIALPDSDINIGATLVAGVEYYLSPTKGAICDFSTLGTGDYICKLGAAISTSILRFKPQRLGVQKA